MSVAADGTGRSARPRGRPPKFTDADVIAAALRVLDTDGLEALTMRRVADDLGVAVMTLYRYVDTKEEIMDRVGAGVLAEIRIDSSTADPWSEQVLAILLGLHKVFRQHPGALELLMSTQAMVGPILDALRERLVALLRSGGLQQQRAVHVLNGLIAYIIGIVVTETGRARRVNELEAHLTQLPATEYPNLVADPHSWTIPVPDTVVEQGLRHLLTGLSEGSS